MHRITLTYARVTHGITQILILESHYEYEMPNITIAIKYLI